MQTRAFGLPAAALAVLALLTGPLLVEQALPGNGFTAAAVQAAEDGEPPRKTRKTPALKEQVYKRLAKAQEFIDAKDLPGAMEELRKMEERPRGMNGYELGSMYNMMAFVAYQMEDYGGALRYYDKVLEQGEDIPIALELSTLYTASQLYFIQEDYDRSLSMLDRWFNHPENLNPGPPAYIYKAQLLYQAQRFREAIPVVLAAMDVARERGTEVQEQWWLLLRAFYYELEEWPKVLEVLEVLLQQFPKQEYYIQTSGIAGQLGEERKQLGILQAAHIAGMLEKEREYMNLFGLLMNGEVPWLASQVLKDGFDAGVVEADASNLRSLGQAYQLSQEVDRALPVYQRAAKLAEDGEIYDRIAALYLEKDQCAESVEAAENALRKGGLRNEDQTHVVKGMCLFNLDRLTDAKRSFREACTVARAEDRKANCRLERQWIAYIENEEKRRKALADAG